MYATQHQADLQQHELPNNSEVITGNRETHKTFALYCGAETSIEVDFMLTSLLLAWE
jgi:hypothetical protein